MNLLKYYIYYGKVSSTAPNEPLRKLSEKIIEFNGRKIPGLSKCIVLPLNTCDYFPFKELKKCFFCSPARKKFSRLRKIVVNT